MEPEGNSYGAGVIDIYPRQWAEKEEEQVSGKISLILCYGIWGACKPPKWEMFDWQY